MASETKKNYSCSAVVTLTLRVIGEGHWGSEATVAEVQRIGGRETLAHIERALKDGNVNYELVSQPKIGAITWEPK